jgi:hydrogenase expression/formation protein HypC
MCLGIPAKLVEIHTQDDLPMGKVEFGGIRKDVCLAYTPEAQIGDYVLVHVGFAISRIDPSEAEEIFDFLRQIERPMETEGSSGFRDQGLGDRIQGAGMDECPISFSDP